VFFSLFHFILPFPILSVPSSCRRLPTRYITISPHPGRLRPTLHRLFVPPSARELDCAVVQCATDKLPTCLPGCAHPASRAIGNKYTGFAIETTISNPSRRDSLLATIGTLGFHINTASRPLLSHAPLVDCLTSLTSFVGVPDCCTEIERETPARQLSRRSQLHGCDVAIRHHRQGSLTTPWLMRLHFALDCAASLRIVGTPANRFISTHSCLCVTSVRHPPTAQLLATENLNHSRNQSAATTV
jgi:hypothetical protein